MRVEEHGLSVAEVRHDAELEVLRNAALEDRPDPPHHERVVHLMQRIVEAEPAIELDQCPDLEVVRAVSGADVEAVVPLDHDRR